MATMKRFSLMTCALVVFMAALGIQEANAQSKKFDPNMTVYLDPIYNQVHTGECGHVAGLKKYLKTMTLEEADKAGVWIGKLRTKKKARYGSCGNKCLIDYKRKHPAKPVPDDAYVLVSKKKWYTHMAGCHRMSGGFSIGGRRTVKEAREQGYKKRCPFCCESRWIHATISEENWKENPITPTGMVNFTDPVARGKVTINWRFFFVGTGWGELTKYRYTGDEAVRQNLRKTAQEWNEFVSKMPDVAQLKARSLEGMPFLMAMAASARVNLQLARKHSGKVSPEEISEAETFLKNVIATFDPKMCTTKNWGQGGAPNRKMNGVATIALTYAALKDLQAIKKTTEYQPTIDQYRKVATEYIKWFRNMGHFCEFDGKNHFYYPYASGGTPRVVDGCKVFGRPEDTGHSCNTVRGLITIYDASRDLGVDDELLTAFANTYYQNATVAQVKVGKEIAGLLQCPTGYRVHKRKMKSKNYNPGRDDLFVFHAFHDKDKEAYVDGLCTGWSQDKRKNILSGGKGKDRALFGDYLKALRKETDLIYLGETK